MAGDLLHDTFTRSASGAWGTADDGHTYTLTTAANFSVNGTRGVIALPSANSLQTAVSNATSKQDAEVYAELAWTAIPVGAVTQSYLFLRYTDGSNHYRLRLQLTTGGNLIVNITRVVAGTGTDLFTNVTAVTGLATNTLYAAKIRATGGNTPVLQAKVWLLSGAEPSAWTLNNAAAVDSSPYTTSGGYAIRHQQNTGGTNLPSLQVETLDVTDLTVTTPSGAARILAFGDQAGNVARSSYARAAAVTRIGATAYRAVHVGDEQYDGGWYRELMQTNGYDAAMGALNANIVTVPGNHDYQNPVGGPSLTSSSPLAKWVSGTAASAWNTADKLCVPTTAAKATGFYYEASATGTTGGSEPNWATAVTPGATISDNTVTWTARWPGQDWHAYINQRKSGGVYAAYSASDEPNAAASYTRPSGSAELTAQGAIYGTQYCAYNSGTDPLNPHNEYGVELLSGTDGSGTYQWLVCYVNTELEYGKRPGDTHTASGYGPASSTIGGAVTTPSLQYQYFQKQFTSAAYQGTPKILVLHWPPFHSGGSWPRVQALCSLFIQNGGRIILAGHHHNYQRFVPVDSTFSETTHAGGALPSESAVLVIQGNSGIDLGGLGTDPVYSLMFDVRGTTGTLAGGPVNSATASYYGFTDVTLDRAGFSITHVVGADSTGAQITYPAASNGSIFDTAAYTFGALTAPVTPTLSASPSTTPTNTAARTFTFSTTTSGSTLERNLDNAGWVSITSPETVTAAAGAHSYQVRALKNGLYSGVASHFWTYTPATTTTSTYTPVTGDVGYRIRAKIIATNAAGSSSPVPTAWSEPVSSGPELVTTPIVSGTGFTGSPLSVTDGEWNPLPTSVSYQWQSAPTATGAWTNITGETANTTTPATGDATKFFRANVSATTTDGTTTVASTVLGPIILGAPQNTDAPSIIGFAPFNPLDVLATSDGSWTGSQPITFAYAWQRGADQTGPWVYITGETLATYQTVSTDAGWWIRSAVTATNSAGSATAYSDPVQVTPSQIITVIPTTSWRWVLCERDGTPLGLLEPSARWLEPGVDQSWSAGFTISLSADLAALIEPGRTRLKVYRAGGILAHHGKVWITNEQTDDAGDGTIEVTSWDQLRQLEYDHVTADATKSVLYKLDDNETAWTIISDLIGRANGYATAQDGAEIRIGQQYGTGYAAKHRKFEAGTTILDAIMSFTGQSDPIELIPRPVEDDIHTLSWPPSAQTPELVETITRLDVHQHVGGDSTAVFGYAIGPQNLISVTRTRDFSTVRNRVIATGATIGSAKARRSDAQTADTSRSRLGLMEEFADYSNIKNKNVLDDRAAGILRRAPRPEITAIPSFNAPRLWTDFNLGDTVLLLARYGSLQINKRVRVKRARIEFDDDGYDKLTQITFGAEET